MPGFVRNLWPALLWLTGLLVITLIPGNFVPKTKGFWSHLSADKIIHLVLFAGQSFLLLKGLAKQYPEKSGRYKLEVVLLLSVILAALTEVLQWLLPIKRDGNFFDGLANIVGITIGLTAYLLVVRKKYQKLKTKQKID